MCPTTVDYSVEHYNNYGKFIFADAAELGLELA